jgi:hypothetical protein
VYVSSSPLKAQKDASQALALREAQRGEVDLLKQADGQARRLV